MSIFSVSLPIDADIYSVSLAADGDPWNNRYDADTGLWWLDASSQEALDAAVAAYDYTADRLARLKVAKIGDLATQRFNMETGGIVLNGSLIRTDRESQGLISGAYTAAKDGVITTFDFKTETGWITLTAEQIMGIGQAVAAHVQGCFSYEKVLTDQINAAVDEASLDAIDITVGWP